MVGLGHIPLELVRNLGVLAHVDAGKTTTTERLLVYTGVETRVGEVHDGAATMDFLAQEKERGITISAAATSVPWDGHRIQIIDTPGHVDFAIEVERSLRVLDGAVILLDAEKGVEAQTEAVWRQADRYALPRVCFINKMDRPGADFAAAVCALEERLAAPVVALQLPMGSGSGFDAVIDVVHQRMLRWPTKDPCGPMESHPIPADWVRTALAARDRVFDRVAGFDEALERRYLEGEHIPGDELARAVRRACLALEACPVLCGSALDNRGIEPLLDAMAAYLPSPRDFPAPVARTAGNAVVRIEPNPAEPLVAMAFKVVADRGGARLTFVRIYRGELRSGSEVLNPRTGQAERVRRVCRVHANQQFEVAVATTGMVVAVEGLARVVTGDTLCASSSEVRLESLPVPEPVFSVAVLPQTEADRLPLEAALAALLAEDPSLAVRADPETGQTLLGGLGELHLDVSVERLRRDFGVGVAVGRRLVAYRETVSAAARREGRCQRSVPEGVLSARVVLEVGPGVSGPEGGQSLRMSSDVSVRRQWWDAVRDGVREAAVQGGPSGYEVSDISVRLLEVEADGPGPVALAVRTAAALAFAHAVRAAEPTVLEPLMRVEVTVPESATGDVVGDLQARRGRVVALDPRAGAHVVIAEVPLASMIGYASDLRSRTRGRASFSMRFGSYSPVPSRVAEGVLANAQVRP